MIFGPFLPSFCRLLLVAQLVFAADPAIILMKTECGETVGDMILHSLNVEIPDMLAMAGIRGRLLLYKLNAGLWRYSELGLYDAVTHRTFSNMIYQHQGDGDPEEQERLRILLSKFIDIAADVRHNLLYGDSDPSRKLQVTCNHDWLVSTGNDDEYWDKRGPPYASEDDHSVQIAKDLSEFDQLSETNVEDIWPLSLPYDTVLLINKHNEPTWRVVPDKFYRVPYAQVRVEQVGRLILLQDMMTHHLSATLLRSLTQTWAMASGPNMVAPLISEPCDDQISDHAWLYVPAEMRCVFRLAREDPDKALWSSLNFQYLVVALYLSSSDWSRGFSQPLGTPRYGAPIGWEILSLKTSWSL